MLEEESAQLDPSLSFQTPFDSSDFDEKRISICELVSKTKSYECSSLMSTAFSRSKQVALTTPSESVRLTHRIIYCEDNYNLADLVRVKKFVSPDKLVHFDIRDCFYRLNPSLLPENLRQLSLREINIPSDKHRFGYYAIYPKRGLIACFATCKWFSDVVINENPFISACMVDDCFCSIENQFDAKQWFIDRGFEINNKPCKEKVLTNIKRRMFEMGAECSICLASRKYSNLACFECGICQECYYKIHASKQVKECRQCPDCLNFVNLQYLFFNIHSQVVLPSVDLFIDAISSGADITAILFDLTNEVSKNFPKYNKLICVGCNKNNVTALCDKGVYKCDDCKKIYCPTCDINEISAEKHNCICPIGRCPKCHVFVEKIAGCNHIKCNCGCEFIYRANSFVDNFNVDLEIMLHSKLRIESTDTIEDVMARVSQISPRKIHINMFNSLKMCAIDKALVRPAAGTCA